MVLPPALHKLPKDGLASLSLAWVYVYWNLGWVYVHFRPILGMILKFNISFEICPSLLKDSSFLYKLLLTNQLHTSRYCNPFFYWFSLQGRVKILFSTLLRRLHFHLEFYRNFNQLSWKCLTFVHCRWLPCR